MDSFDWYYRNISIREAQLKLYQETGLKQDNVTDYWWFINRINEIKLEIYTLEEMAQEEGIYIV